MCFLAALLSAPRRLPSVAGLQVFVELMDMQNYSESWAISQILFRAQMIQTIPETENTLGTSNSIMASISLIFYLIVLENPNRVCLISSKYCKCSKHNFSLNPCPFHLWYLIQSNVLCMLFVFWFFFLIPRPSFYTLGGESMHWELYLSCRYHLHAVA